MHEIFETVQNDEHVLNIPDDTGLTNHEKVALVGAWSLVKKDLIFHGRNIFVRFFEEYPKYLNYFDFSQDKTAPDIGENRSLHAHALNVMHFFGTLIDYCLENPPLFKCSLIKLKKNHQKHGVGKKDVEVVCGVIVKYCLEALSQHRSATLESAFASFMKSIVESFDE